ncbi:hypothetical protein [Pseudobacteriovorax antillogorgiicola]|uniref:hypothetical protein n=1 Tax=Pseudobacteriovorax antillogorgiicola TaxID=1513793 RepID=UPI00117B10D9|nr:hypothetical protein [Pseudobacteriovorax antillogorgiicola]
MKSKTSLVSWLVTLGLLFSSRAWGNTDAPLEYRHSAWSIGLTFKNHILRSPQENNFLGTAAAIQLGRTYVYHRWIAGLSLDVLTGPYESPERQNIVVDFTGTGASGYIGYGLSGEPTLQSGTLDYGLILNLGYGDMIGRSVSQRVRTSEDDEPVNNWVMRINDFSIAPAIFVSWLKPARPEGNSPELLVTRIEGVFVHFGALFPIQTKYKLQYDQGESTFNDNGDLKGHTWFLAITALIGV